jgi:hypothetical protein
VESSHAATEPNVAARGSCSITRRWSGPARAVLCSRGWHGAGRSTATTLSCHDRVASAHLRRSPDGATTGGAITASLLLLPQIVSLVVALVGVAALMASETFHSKVVAVVGGLLAMGGVLAWALLAAKLVGKAG